ncbi:MAG: DUF5677 domain-containing protein [Blastocatellia bacterium]
METDSNLSTTDQWIAHIDDLLSLLSAFNDMAIMAPDTPHDKEAAKVVAFKFVQAVRTLRATVVLSKAGDSSNAIILTRSMLENFIDAVFLMRNPKEIWRYLEEAADLESKMEISRRKYNPQNEGPNFGTRPSSVQLRQQFQSLGDQHSTIRSWRKLNLRTRAERAEHSNILALYEMIYPLTSAYAHGSSTILMEYLREPIDHETGFHFSYTPNDAEVEVALTWGAMIFLGFLACMDILMDIGLRDRLERLSQRELELMSITQDNMLARRIGRKSPAP